MRKYSLLLLVAAVLFAMSMMAQTSNSGNNNGSTAAPDPSAQPAPGAYPNSSQPGARIYTDSSKSDTQSGSQTGSDTSAQSSSNATKGAKEKTVEGCIVREQTDYFLFPKKGKPMRLTGQDVSAHLNHHVKVHGTEENAPGGGATTASNTGGTTGSATAGTTGTSGTESQTGGTGSVAGNTGATGTARGATGASNKEFVVDRVDMVSETCPANIQKNINASGMTGGSNSPQ